MAAAKESALPLLDAHAPGCAPPRPSRRGRRRALVLVGVHLLVLAHIAQWKLGGRTLTPLEPSEAGETLTLGYVNAGFLLLALSLLATLVLGRFFCGWACHVVFLQDASAWLLGRFGLRPRPLRSRLLAFVPLFAAVWMFVLPSALGLWHGADLPSWSWHLTTDDLWARFPGPWMALLTFLVVGFLAVWFLGAKGFCTYGCPYGALFAMADRFAAGRIRVDESCEQCGHCTAACTSNVRVHEEVARFGAVVDPGCMKCMDCVSVCPMGALSFGIGRPGRAPAPRRKYDLGIGEELVAAATFAAGLYAFKGLYARVPFLLAIALAVLAAVGVIVIARLATRGTFTFQRYVWKRAGRLTGGGVLALAGIALFLAFGSHSGIVQYHEREGEGWLLRARAAPRGSGERARALAFSRVHLERSLHLGLLETAGLHNELGQIAVEEGRHGEAREELTRAAELDPEIRSARILLVDLALERGELDRALSWLEELVAIDPLDPLTARRLQTVLGRHPDEPRALALLDRIVAAAR